MIYIFDERRKSIQDAIGDVYFTKSENGDCVLNSTTKNSENSFCDCKTSFQMLNSPFREQRLTKTLLSGDATHCFSKKKRIVTTKPKNFPLATKLSPPITTKHRRT